VFILIVSGNVKHFKCFIWNRVWRFVLWVGYSAEYLPSIIKSGIWETVSAQEEGSSLGHGVVPYNAPEIYFHV
jgi:hypothetical protein